MSARPARPPSPEDAAREALARRLRAARERLGASVRDMSRLAGIPAATISALEGGREPRWSTLIRYLETVPGLRADHLLPGAVGMAPAASPSLYAHLRRALGEGAKRVHVLRKAPRGGSVVTEFRVERLVSDIEYATEQDEALALMHIACVGGRDVVRGLQAPQGATGTVTVSEPNREHRFTLARRKQIELDYRCREVTPVADAATRLEHVCQHAVDSLVLAAEVPRGETARLLCWHLARREEGATAEIAALRYPGSTRPRLHRRGGLLMVTIPQVIPGLVHVLAWGEAGAEASEGLVLDEAPEDAGFGPIARSLRARSGHSVRSLAEIMSVSHVTIAEAERARDPGVATLRAYLRALPDVAPQWLLPAREAEGELTALEAWEALRDLHGLEADHLRTSATVTWEAGRNLEDRIEGLRAVGGVERRLVLTNFKGKGIYSRGKGHDVLGVSTEGDADDDVKIRTRKLPGRPDHTMTVPAAVAGRGLTLRIEYLDREVGRLMTRKDVIERHGPTDEPFVSGMGLTAMAPARTMRCVLTLPTDFKPVSVMPSALSFGRPWYPTRGILDLLHPGTWTFTSDPRRNVHVLEVELALPGVKYGICWIV